MSGWTAGRKWLDGGGSGRELGWQPNSFIDVVLVRDGSLGSSARFCHLEIKNVNIKNIFSNVVILKLN